MSLSWNGKSIENLEVVEKNTSFSGAVAIRSDLAKHPCRFELAVLSIDFDPEESCILVCVIDSHSPRNRIRSSIASVDQCFSKCLE